MKFYFAPLVGVTGYVNRNAHHAVFGQIDKYFTPFVSPTSEGIVKQKEWMDVVKENNEGVPVIPQILANDAKFFIATMKQLKEMGYGEVNLNVGCPSAPVVSRGRGSGFLARPEELDHFLEEIFAADLMKISVKTRIGKDSPDEIFKIMDIYNKYPLEDVIIHPRIQKDFYKNTPNRKVFLEAASLSKNPVCYNGDLFTKEDYETFHQECKEIDRVMFGRGLLHNPALVREILGGKPAAKVELIAMHNQIYSDYKAIYPMEAGILARMKQFWAYEYQNFDNADLIWNQIKECESLAEYDRILTRIFA